MKYLVEQFARKLRDELNTPSGLTSFHSNGEPLPSADIERIVANVEAVGARLHDQGEVRMDVISHELANAAADTDERLYADVMQDAIRAMDEEEE